MDDWATRVLRFLYAVVHQVPYSRVRVSMHKAPYAHHFKFVSMIRHIHPRDSKDSCYISKEFRMLIGMQGRRLVTEGVDAIRHHRRVHEFYTSDSTGGKKRNCCQKQPSEQHINKAMFRMDYYAPFDLLRRHHSLSNTNSQHSRNLKTLPRVVYHHLHEQPAISETLAICVILAISCTVYTYSVFSSEDIHHSVIIAHGFLPLASFILFHIHCR